MQEFVVRNGILVFVILEGKQRGTVSMCLVQVHVRGPRRRSLEIRLSRN